ncbi:related to U4/U6 snRNP-associated 61 kDa protein [Melanopsichium pennsylvanicum]|uniref:Related to U4/U6 snRNP-associated 61 kDa protein n=2 Tax=Melanopsichium pennsylvanicum TaxID=63383 RepID=A0AAJ4XFT7_9BASI|nr:related to U4/U6 snRNP-associated 61 kDa protein [Melanopsichium pennsylvanicum 4]SNX81680.1 related to U4/U6 snRNP-associated 61 kDa protein [Melanopsichium pennsylvanicum]
MTSFADELLADFGSDEEQEIGTHEQVEVQPSTNEAHSNGRKRAHPHNGDILQQEFDRDNKRVHLDDADLDELEDGSDDDETLPAVDSAASSSTTTNDSAMKLGRNAVQPASERDQADVESLDLTKTTSVHSVATLLTRGSIVSSILEQIDHFMSLPEPDLAGVLEDSPEYRLIVTANNIAVDVDNELMLVQKFIRDHYSPRFPELESLIPNPWDYIQAVRAIGNAKSIPTNELEDILPHGTVVVISMTASTTSGKPLAASEWTAVQEALGMVFELQHIRNRILEYVESRMSSVAPNLSAVVGTRTATKLLGVAGGLEGLSKIPACNLHLLGAAKKNTIGLSSSTSSARSNGFVMQCDLIANTSDDYKRQAVRMVSAKALLAARMDAGKTTSRDGSYGQRLHQELSKKLEKLLEPPPQKLEKVLPIPKEGSDGKKRRGGRKVRKAKERNGMTELRKMQNRMEFGKQEEEAFGYDESVGLGMINSSASGKIRAQTAEERSKGKISKANKNRLAALRGASMGGTSSVVGGKGGSMMDGTATSLSFTPVQGIELVDPSSRGKKKQEEEAKWFKQGQFSLLPKVHGSSLPGSMGPPAPPTK